MKKAVLSALLATASILVASDAPSEHKTVLTFPITISKANIHNPTKTINNGYWHDEMDALSCKILGIAWPEQSGEKLWYIDKSLYSQTGDQRKHTRLRIPTKYFDPEVVNLFLRTDLQKTFLFPETLPDTFVQNLVKEGSVQYPCKNAIVRFTLENTDESLKELGLFTEKPAKRTLITSNTPQVGQPQSGGSYFSTLLYVGIPVGIGSLLIWLSTKVDLYQK